MTCLQHRRHFFAFFRRAKASVNWAKCRARLETRVTEGSRGKARYCFFLRLHPPRVSGAPRSLRAYLRSPEKHEKVTLVMLAPKRDRMFAAEILLRERIFSGKSDACNWIASRPRSVKQVLRGMIPVLKISFQLTAFLPSRMFESMVIHCFGATSHEMCLVYQFATYCSFWMNLVLTFSFQCVKIEPWEIKAWMSLAACRVMATLWSM